MDSGYLVMVEINLLKDRRKKIVKQHRQESKRNRVSLIVLGAVVVVFLVLQVVRLVFVVIDRRLDNQLRASKAAIDDLSQVEKDIASVASRLKEVGKIVEGRELIDEKLAVIFKVIGRDTDLKRIEFGGLTKGRDLVIDGTTESVFAYVSLSEDLKQLAEEEGFETLTQSSLSRADDWTYSFTFDVMFGQSVDSMVDGG